MNMTKHDYIYLLSNNSPEVQGTNNVIECLYTKRQSQLQVILIQNAYIF